MVVVISPEADQDLEVSTRPYDRMVAGVISGAGDIHPGLVLAQDGSEVDGEHPVALSGRVYVRAEAFSAPIQPGDLLTTSDLPGHAMKATEWRRTQGAVLGKALTELEAGEGLVLVLVSLQ